MTEAAAMQHAPSGYRRSEGGSGEGGAGVRTPMPCQSARRAPAPHVQCTRLRGAIVTGVATPEPVRCLRLSVPDFPGKPLSLVLLVGPLGSVQFISIPSRLTRRDSCS